MPNLLSLLPALGLTLAWLSPLHLLPWVNWHSELPVFVGVLGTAMIAAALRLTRGGAGSLPMPTLAIGLAGLALVAVLQPATGLVAQWGDAWTIVLYAALCIAAFLLGSESVRKDAGGEGHVKLLAGTLLLAGLGCSLIALVQSLDVWTSSEWITRTRTGWRRPGSNLAQANQMATMVLMGLVSLVYLFEKRRLGVAVVALLAGVLGLGIVTTESRTALLSLVALAIWWRFRCHASRIPSAVVAGLLLLVWLGYAIWPRALVLFHGMEGTALAAASGMNLQVGLRAIVWPQLLEAAWERPWLGWGLRQTPAALTSVLDRQPLSEAYSYSHNAVLDLLLGVGAPLALLVLAGTLLWIWRRRGARADLTGWYLLGICLPFALHAMLEFPHTYAYFLAPVFFALGILDARTVPQARFQVPSALAAGFAALAVGLGAWVVVEYVAIEEDFRVARFEASRIGETPGQYERPPIRVLTQFNALLDGARIVPKPHMSAEQIQVARDAAYRFPWPALQNRYALSLALNGNRPEALRMLRVIRAMHGQRTYQEIRFNWQVLATEFYPELLSTPLPP